MNHPLTDEICREVADSMTCFPKGFPDAHDSMRAGADWQLARVIEWLGEYETVDSEEHDSIVCLIHSLKKAMRPQEES